MLERKDHRQRLVWNIFERYYLDPNNPLKKEIKLFNIILETNLNSKETAQKLLDVFYKHCRVTNTKLLEQTKTKLINELQATIGLGFLKAPIDDYKLLATIQQLLNNHRFKSNMLNEVEKIKLEDALIQHLLESKSNNIKTKKETKEDEVDSLVLEIAAQSWFKGIKELSSYQKDILKKYFECFGTAAKVQTLYEEVYKDFNKFHNILNTYARNKAAESADEQVVEILKIASEKASIIKEELNLENFEKHLPDILILSDMAEQVKAIEGKKEKNG